MNTRNNLKTINRRLSLTVLVITALLAVFTPLAVLADGCNIGELLPPCACSGNCQLNDFLALASNLAQWGVGILAGIVVGILIYGGFGMIMTFGNPEKIEANKKLLGGTFRGMAVVLLGWVIVSTIIYFLTGLGDGLLYQGADKTTGPWWHFTETPASCPSSQVCTDVRNQDETWQKAKNCKSYGICPGDEFQICCDP